MLRALPLLLTLIAALTSTLDFSCEGVGVALAAPEGVGAPGARGCPDAGPGAPRGWGRTSAPGEGQRTPRAKPRRAPVCPVWTPGPGSDPTILPSGPCTSHRHRSVGRKWEPPLSPLQPVCGHPGQSGAFAPPQHRTPCAGHGPGQRSPGTPGPGPRPHRAQNANAAKCNCSDGRTDGQASAKPPLDLRGELGATACWRPAQCS